MSRKFTVRRIIARALLANAFACGGASAFTITPETDPAVLANRVAGPGVTILNATLTTAGTSVVQTGTFVGGNSIGLDIDRGIILTTGDVSEVDNPNTGADGVSGVAPETNGVGAGNADLDRVLSSDLAVADADLDLLVAPDATFDEAILTIDFSLAAPSDIFVSYQFGSEEYLDYVGSNFNDGFGFFVDGVNVALTPGSQSPVTINTINGFTNATFFQNNVPNTEGYPVDATLLNGISYDGVTKGLVGVRANLAAGPHQIKFAIADVGDSALDAGVLIGSFSTVPEPSTACIALLAISAGCVAGMRSRLG